MSGEPFRYGVICVGRVASLTLTVFVSPFRQFEIVRNRRGDFLEGDAEIGVLDLAVRDQRVGDRANRVRWDREPDADVGAGLACDLRVDADHLSGRVEEGAAGVAV